MRRGLHVPIPESRHDLLRLWATARRLTPATRPSWLAAEDADGYRLVASVSLAGLSAADRDAADREFEAAELARLVVDEDASAGDERRVYVAAPRPQPVWSIGIRTGDAPWALGDAAVVNPALSPGALTDAAASSVADPFLFRHGDRWHMFFEVDNWRSWKGEIGLATSVDGFAWNYEGIVLAEPFHLSYPCVFAGDDGGVYMTPESSQANAVRLYRAREFPRAWEHVGDLVRGLPFADPTVVEHGGRWWLFTETSGGADDTLRLFHAAALDGRWAEHPASPIVRGDATHARPAGRIVAADGRLVRFAQNCRPAYGTEVRALEIVTLTETDYAERPIGGGPILGPGAGWNAGGMHHVDPVCLGPGRWLAAVDGWRMEDAVA